MNRRLYMLIAWVGLLGSIVSAADNTLRLDLVGDFHCSISLYRDGKATDALIQEVRSLGMRVYEWRIDDGVKKRTLVGFCGVGKTCGANYDSLGGYARIRVVNDTGCVIEVGPENKVE